MLSVYTHSNLALTTFTPPKTWQKWKWSPHFICYFVVGCPFSCGLKRTKFFCLFEIDRDIFLRRPSYESFEILAQYLTTYTLNKTFNIGNSHNKTIVPQLITMIYICLMFWLAFAMKCWFEHIFFLWCTLLRRL